MTNSYSDAMPRDAMGVQHSTERHGSCETERAKNAVSRRPVNRRCDAFAGLGLRSRGGERCAATAGGDLDEFSEGTQPPHGLSAQKHELRLADIAYFNPPSAT